MLVLAVAGALIRLTGFIYRAPLARLIHAEGLGIYQMAQPAFYALLAVALGGIPLAVSNLVAEYTAGGRSYLAHRVLQLAVSIVAISSAAAAATLALAAPVLARFLGDQRTYWSLLALAPAIFLFSLEGCYRAFFQGRQLMTPAAAAQSCEQVLRVTATLVLAYWLFPRGLEFAAAGAAFGATAGACASLGYLIWRYRRLPVEPAPRWQLDESDGWLRRRIFSLAWPGTVGGVLLPMLTLADVGIIQRSLMRAGYAAVQATALYGQYSGMAFTLVNLPSVLTGALASVLMPAAASALAKKNIPGVTRRLVIGIRVTALVCLPASLGMMVLARPLTTLVFAEPAAAIPLLWLAPVAFLMPLGMVMGAVLFGLGRTGLPVRNIVIGMALKLGLDLMLAARLGIRGVAAAAVVSHLISCWLNAIALEQQLGETLPWGRLLGGPALASGAMAVVLTLLLRRTGGLGGDLGVLALGLLVAPVAYAAALAILGGLRRRDLVELSGPLAPHLERLFQLWPRE